MGSPDRTAVGATLTPNTFGSYMPPLTQTPSKAATAEGTLNGKKARRSRNKGATRTNSSKETELEAIGNVAQPILTQGSSKPAVALNADEKNKSPEKTISAADEKDSPKDPSIETPEKSVTAQSPESAYISPSVKLFMQLFPDIASNESLDEASLKDALSEALKREEIEDIEEEVKGLYESRIKGLEAKTKALEEDKRVLRNEIVKIGEEKLGQGSEFSKDRELLLKYDVELKKKISEIEGLLEKIKNLEETQSLKSKEYQEELKSLQGKLASFNEDISQKEAKEANIRLARSLVTTLGASLDKITDKDDKESESLELTQEEVRIILQDCEKKIGQLYKLLDIQKIDTLAPPKRTFKEWQESIKLKLNELHKEKGALEGNLDYIKRKLAEEKGSKNNIEFKEFQAAKEQWSKVTQTMIEQKKKFEKFFLALLEKVQNGEERVSDVARKAINSVSNALKGISTDEIAIRLDKQTETHNNRYKLLETILLQWKGLEDSLNNHGNFILFNTLVFEKTEFTKEVTEQLEKLRAHFLDFSVIELPTLRQSFLMISLQHEVDSLRAFINFAAQTRRYLRKIGTKDLSGPYQLIKATFGELMRKKTLLIPDVEILKNAIEEQVRKWELDPTIPEKRLEQIAIILKISPEQVKATYYEPYLEEHRKRFHQLEAIQSNLAEYDLGDFTKSLWMAVQEIQRLHDALMRNGEHISETWFNRSPLVGGGIRDEEVDQWSKAYPLDTKKEAEAKEKEIEPKGKEKESKGKEKDAVGQRKGK